VVVAKTPEGKAAREAMAKASGTDLAGFEAQLAATKLFDKPADATAFTRSADISKTMDKVRKFLFEHELMGNGAKSADVVGIEFADGKVLGDKAKIGFRFTDAYMAAAADGKL
jgi:NitT/TauT family transport system substrate-binding protein